jgi:uncharacterized membrane protein YqjE
MPESDFETESSGETPEVDERAAPRPSLNERLMGQPMVPVYRAVDEGRRSLSDRVMSQDDLFPQAPAPFWGGQASNSTAEQLADESWEAESADYLQAEELPSPDESPMAGGDPQYVVDQLAASGGIVQVNPGLVEASLDDARTYIRVRYGLFMASVLVVLALAVLVGVALLVMLATSAGWRTVASMAVLEGLAIVLLLVLQYRPARIFSSAAWQVAQLEATRAQLNNSFQVWERFLAEREESRPLSAQDIALAVSSLNAAAQGLFQFEQKERELEQKSSRNSRAAGARMAPGRSTVSPNPRRY